MNPSATDYAKLDGLNTFYKPEGIEEIENNILSFLNMHSIALNDIDLVITGKNGDKQSDELLCISYRNVFLIKKM